MTVHTEAFLRLLGIPATSAEPTPYDLLGLDEEAFSPALVAGALDRQTARVRQAIPGPAFIAVVPVWEAELRRAADVLSDPAQRQAFHDRRQRETSEPALQRLTEHRQAQIQRARQFLGRAVGDDGTLDDAQRAAAVDGLRKLGLGRQQGADLLAQTPRPPGTTGPATDETMAYFAHTVDLSAGPGLASEHDEAALCALADRLAIPAEAAARTIRDRFRQASGSGVHRPDAPAPDVSGRSTPVTQDASSPAPHVPREAGQHAGLKILAVAVPAVAVVLFAALVLTFAFDVWRRGAPRGASATRRPSASTPWPQAWPEGSADRRAPGATRRPTTPSAPARGAPASPRLRARPPTSRPVTGSGPGRTPRATPTPQATTAPVPAIAPRVGAVYSRTGRARDLLGDLALTMLACRECATRLASRSAGASSVLDRLLAQAPGDRVDALTAGVTLVAERDADPLPDPSAPNRAVPQMDRAQLMSLTRDLHFGSPGKRYRAVRLLSRSGSDDAADALLVVARKLALARTLRPDGERLLHRLLHALGRMTNPRVAHRLVALLPGCRDPVAAVSIVRTLARGTGVDANVGGAHLMVSYKRSQLQTCWRWWQAQLADEKLKWQGADRPDGGDVGLEPGPAAAPGARAEPRVPDGQRGLMPGGVLVVPERVSKPAPVWAPDAETVKRLGAAAGLAKQAAQTIDAFRWNERADVGRPRRGVACRMTVSATRVGNDLTDALRMRVHALRRLVLAHPDKGTATGRASRALLMMNARILSSDTALQEAVAMLDAAAEMLELLVRLRRPGRAGQPGPDLDALRRRRQAAVAKPDNVLEELRTSAYHNLILWDLLLGGKRTRPTGARRAGGGP